MAKKSTKDSIVDVRNAISVTTPKYCDKTLKRAFLNCAIHYGLHGDKNQFHSLFAELPRGVWNERLKTFYEFVIAIPKSDMRSRFSEVRAHLDDIIRTPKYKSTSEMSTKNREGFSYQNVNIEIISALKHSEIHGDTGKLKHVLMRMPLSYRIKIITKITEISSYGFYVNGHIYRNSCRFIDSEFRISQAKIDGDIRVAKGNINEGFNLDEYDFIS